MVLFFLYLCEKLVTMIKALIFDLDNTLVDTTPLLPIVDAVAHAKEKKEKDALWMKHDATIPMCKEYDGLFEIVKNLHEQGIKIAVVTNSVKRRIDAIAKYYKIPIDVAIGRYSVIPRVPILKPDRRLFDLALDKLGVERGEVISFGNEPVDIQLAKNANVASVACRWGASDEQWKEMLALIPTNIITSPKEILNLI